MFTSVELRAKKGALQAEIAAYHAVSSGRGQGANGSVSINAMSRDAYVYAKDLLAAIKEIENLKGLNRPDWTDKAADETRRLDEDREAIAASRRASGY